MNERYAGEIINWKYEGILSVYNLENNEDTLRTLLSSDYYAVVNKKNNLTGFFCTGEAAVVPQGHEYHVYDDNRYTDIGIGMNQKLVGKRLGYPFMLFCLSYLKKHKNINRFRLTVIDFNRQAIAVYHKAGFITENYFITREGYYFLVMTLND